jgi:hypothetical protein
MNSNTNTRNDNLGKNRIEQVRDQQEIQGRSNEQDRQGSLEQAGSKITETTTIGPRGEQQQQNWDAKRTM